MRVATVLLSLLLLLAPLGAQDYEAADQHALDAPPKAGRSLESLAAYLRRGFFTKEDKARTLYRWMCENIAYDVEGYLQEAPQDTSPEAVLVRRKTVCDGYARLYEALGLQMGLQVVRVVGVARGVSNGKSGHAWNAVRLSHGWVLVDCTWGAGSMNVEKRSYEPGFTSFYFATDPNVFITTHFPEDSAWQLLPKPLTREQYDQLHTIRETWADRAHPGAPAAWVATARPPRSFYSMRARGVELVTPAAGTLRAGTTENFHLRALGASRLVVVTGGGSHELPATHAGEFVGSIPLLKGPVRVLGDFTGGRLEPLLEYRAQ